MTRIDEKILGKKIAALIKDIKNNENNESYKSEFYILVSSYYKNKYRNLFRSKEDFEDAVQDVTFRLLQNIDIFEEDKNPLPFIKTSFKNDFIDVFRKLKSRVKRETFNAIKENDSFTEEYNTYILDIKKLMNNKEETIFYKRYESGLSDEEICVSLNISRPYYFKLLRSLRKKIIKYVYG